MQNNENNMTESESDIFEDEPMFDQIELEDMEFEQDAVEKLDSEE
jgi:hypothetical protein